MTESSVSMEEVVNTEETIAADEVKETAAVNLTDEEQQYKEAVTTLYNQHSDYIFQNDDARYGLIFVEAIFDLTRKVRIFEDDLCKEFPGLNCIWDSIEKHLKEEGGELEIVTNNIDEETRNRLKGLAEAGKVTIKKVSPHFLRQIDSVTHDIVKDNLLTPNEHINFTVGDNSSFRLELPSQPTRKVLCSAYNTEISTKLLNAFDKGFPSAENYDL